MDRVDEAVALGLLGVLAVVLRVAQQARRHARPQREDDEGEQVAQRHGPPARLVQPGARVAEEARVGAVGADERAPLARGGEVVQDHEEEDGAGDVDERVDAVGPLHQRRVLEEPLLDGDLEEEPEGLLEVDDLQRVLAGDVDRLLDEG